MMINGNNNKIKISLKIMMTIKLRTMMEMCCFYCSSLNRQNRCHLHLPPTPTPRTNTHHHHAFSILHKPTRPKGIHTPLEEESKPSEKEPVMIYDLHAPAAPFALENNKGSWSICLLIVRGLSVTRSRLCCVVGRSFVAKLLLL